MEARRQHFSFRLVTLFWATVVVAAFGAVGAAMGIAGLIIFVAMAVGVFGGLFACSMLDLGFAFSDLRQDIAKCLVVSLVVTGLTYGCAKYFGGLGLGILPISWLVTMKVCWFGLEKVELLLVFATTFVTAATMARVVLQFLDGT